MADGGKNKRYEPLSGTTSGTARYEPAQAADLIAFSTERHAVRNRDTNRTVPPPFLEAVRRYGRNDPLNELGGRKAARKHPRQSRGQDTPDDKPVQLDLLALIDPLETLARELCRKRIEAMPFYKALPPRRRPRAVNREVDKHWHGLIPEARRQLQEGSDDRTASPGGRPTSGHSSARHPLPAAAAP
jgi:hypothetical protein